MSNPSVDVDLADPRARLEVVRAAWREVLGIADVADHISFFDAGGDSIRLVILVERLNELTGRALRTVDLFRAGTVRGHAELLAAPARAEAAAVARTAGRPDVAGRDRVIEAARLRTAGPAGRGH